MLQHLPVVCLPILAQRHRDTLVLEAQQEDLAGTAVPGALSLGRICTFCPAVVALEGQHSEIMLWNMEESSLPEKEAVCPGSISVWLCLSGLV